MNVRNEILAELAERRNKAFAEQTAVDHGRALAFDEAIEVVIGAFAETAVEFDDPLDNEIAELIRDADPPETGQ